MGRRRKRKKYLEGALMPLPPDQPVSNNPTPVPQGQASQGGGQQQVQVERRLMLEMRAFAGPIPPPALLEHYERVVPGAGTRILTQFEEQGRHRRKIENRVVWHNVFGGILGQVLGFALMVGTIGLGGYLIYLDKPVAGLISIISAIGGAAYVLRKAQVEQGRSLATKREQEKRK